MNAWEKILEALVEELRSLQELHEYEVGPEDAALAVSRARLNEILATYELVPIAKTAAQRNQESGMPPELCNVFPAEKQK